MCKTEGRDKEGVVGDRVRERETEKEREREEGGRKRESVCTRMI